MLVTRTARVTCRQWSSPTHARLHAGIRHTSSGPKHYEPIDVEKLLAAPTWSVESLLQGQKSEGLPTISPEQLRHLLRLSALPPPASPDEEAKMLDTLTSQLHFVNEIRKVDTTGVEPLRSLRDETAAGKKVEEVNVGNLKDAFAQEELKGKYYKRIRRQHAPETQSDAESWDVLGSAEKRVGRYFVVEGGKAGSE